MFPRLRVVLAAAAVLATACSGTAVDEGPGAPITTTDGTTTSAAATTTSAAVTTTSTAPTTTDGAGAGTGDPESPEPGIGDLETREPGTGEPGERPIEPADPEGVGDSFYPKLGNPGYDVLHYAIELDVEPADNMITAATTITARAIDELAAFNLDLSGLEIASVTVDGFEAGFSRSGHELTVEPAGPLAAGSQFEAHVAYSGSPQAVEDPGVGFFRVGWQQQEGVIYTASQPSGSMTWFPSNNHPTDKATYRIEITVPEGATAASNGILTDTTTSDGRTTFTWQMDDTMATYLAAVYIGDFERVDHGPLYEGGPRLRDYLPRDASPYVAQALSVTPAAIKFLEGLLGPYPFDAYGTIVMPFQLFFALENQTLSLHGRGGIDPGTIAHEAAHQWLGNSVALDDWSDIWINEGFATYLHLMFEAEHFEMDLDDVMAQNHTLILDLDEAPPKGIEVQDMFNLTVYYRGAATLHALRQHTGDETFFAILRAHYDRSAGDTTNTEEFLGLVDEMAGADAVDLVKSWLYDDDVPAAL